jgi:aminoglycoside phosphotransferase (APT) family kinase protein
MKRGAEQEHPATGADLFPGLRGYLARKFGAAAGAARIMPLAPSGLRIKEGGYGSPHLVEWSAGNRPRRLVLETVRADEFGHEDRPDRAAVILRAFEDYGSLPRHVPAAGAGIFRHGGDAADLEGTGEFFLLMPFADGEPYATDLARIARTGALGETDRARALSLADYLAGIHKSPAPHPTWYRRRLRELTGSGECIAGVADSYPTPNGFITRELLQEVERLALEHRYRLRDASHRLRWVHGDFHPWNILFRGGTEFEVLDRSRGARGEPADDVAALAINYLFFALRTEGKFAGPFEALFHFFWERYLEQSGDRELPAVIPVFFAFRALVLAHPGWYPGESESTRRGLFRFLLASLESGPFEPARITGWLARGRP